MNHELIHENEFNFEIFQRSLSEWRLVFWIAFGIFVFTNLVYVIWASGDIQPFNTPHLIIKSIEEATSQEEKSNNTIT